MVAAAVMAVPPGVAVRAHRRRGKPSERVSVEHETAVGARWVVSRNLSAMIRSGSIVQYTTDDGEVFLDLSARSRRLLTK